MALQISVFLENKVGHFKKVTQVLTKAKINIRTMTLTNTASGWGILNLLTDQPEETYRALSSHGFSAALREVIALEMEDKPGGLDELLEKIAMADVSFDNAFGRIMEEKKRAILLIDVSDIEGARMKLSRFGLSELPDDVVYGR